MIMHKTLAEVRLFSTPGDGSTNIEEENCWVLFFCAIAMMDAVEGDNEEQMWLLIFTDLLHYP